jgi:hypothetical protein
MSPSVGIQELTAIEERFRRVKVDCDSHHREMEEAMLLIGEEIGKLKRQLRGDSPGGRR